MDFSWDDLKLFLAVARLGGLSAATDTTGLSAATLGRRVSTLERQIGERLFVRSQSGYRLTQAGEDLLARAEDVEAAMLSLRRWKEGTFGERAVRVSAGAWTSAFLARHVQQLWQVEDRFGLELVTGNQKVDIGRRNADLGLRNQRPTEQWLAGRLIGTVAYAIYSGRQLINGVKAGYFVGIAGESGHTRSARWLEARHGDRIAVRGNDPMSVRELVAHGAGMSVFPCFVGDSDPQLVRIAAPISELETEQWLVSHHEERHDPAVRAVSQRIAALIQNQRALFNGTASS
ncbi:LysR family transcriptional regulator [Devosia sp.]|uniref:LysR family transcriptional regulator n=1 Tax=Devosia sp. TaxID=1871048 RepID=UPI0027359F5D|nr:LysR family transcriptional regulator [Devosia sp.]MDP2781243.1 LysR family transcriptional regulator [Devosia sp.]